MAGHRPSAEVGESADWTWSLAIAERACCCAARPTVVVVMPPTSARPYPMDLLMCRHHHRLAQRALAAEGAVVYDESGALIAPGGHAHDLGPAGATR